MTLFRIALANIKKYYKDYMIYFITLTFAIASVYSFNSIGEVDSLVNKNSLEGEHLYGIQMIMPILSVFLSFVLAFMILYSNNFLIKRRSKEVGIYLTLGMERKRAAWIFALETIITGLIALVSGLILGLFISQFVGLIIRKFMDTDLKSLSFLFSPKSMVLTCIIFLVIFFIVSLLNIIHIKRLSLIELLQKGKLNEEVRKPSLLVYIGAILSLVILALAYYFIVKSGFNPTRAEFMISIPLGFIGTMLLTSTMSTLVMAIVRNVKGLYYKGLAPFTIRQVDSRMRTTSIYLAMMSILLLVSFGSLISGLAVTDTLKKSAKLVSPLDIFSVSYKEKKILDEFYEGKLKDYMASSFIIERQEVAIEGTSINDYLKVRKEITAFPVEELISYEDFTKMMDLYGKKYEELKDDEVYLVIMDERFYKNLNDINKNYIGMSIDFMEKDWENRDGKERFPARERKMVVKDLIYQPLVNGTIGGATYIVQKDKIARPSSYVLGGYLKDRSEKNQKDLEKLFFNKAEVKNGPPEIMPSNKATIRAMFKSFTMIILFTTIFIGLIFLIAALSIIALRELSALTDSTDKFIALRKLGADMKMIEKSILSQQCVFFLIPLFLGLIHTFFGVYAASNIINMFGDFNFFKFIPIPVIALSLIYLLYMVITYQSTRRIIKDKMEVNDRVI